MENITARRQISAYAWNHVSVTLGPFCKVSQAFIIICVPSGQVKCQLTSHEIDLYNEEREYSYSVEGVNLCGATVAVVRST